MTATALADLIDEYITELIKAGIDDPLHEAFTLSAVLDDLTRLAGLDDPAPAPVDDTQPLVAA